MNQIQVFSVIVSLSSKTFMFPRHCLMTRWKNKKRCEVLKSEIWVAMKDMTCPQTPFLIRFVIFSLSLSFIFYTFERGVEYSQV